MATRRYRIVSSEVLQRIPFDGIVDGINGAVGNVCGDIFIVERKEGFPLNDRWLSHEAIIAYMNEPPWYDEVKYNDYSFIYNN